MLNANLAAEVGAATALVKQERRRRENSPPQHLATSSKASGRLEQGTDMGGNAS
jgi:hypothetical protein